MMRELGNSVKDIAFTMEMTPDAVKGVLKRYRYQNEGQDNPRSGRPTALPDRDKTHIKMLIERNPFISYKEIEERSHLSCHRTTIYRWLIADGIQHKHALRRPFLTEKTAGIRKAWCDKYRHED
jgi:transposase